MKNFKFTLICLVLFFLFTVFNQSFAANPPGWNWAKGAGNTNPETATSIVYTNQGNFIYLTGIFFSDTIQMGTALPSNGPCDFLLAKYDTAGNLIWAKSYGGEYEDAAVSLAVDALDNVLITGTFYSDTLNLDGNMLINRGNGNATSDIFLAKFDPNGTVLWANSSGGIDNDEGRALCLDGNGNILIAGCFRSPSATFGSNLLTLSGTGESFVAKYDPAGNNLWAKGSTGTTFQEANAVVTDQNGNVFIAGRFSSSTLSFGSLSILNAGSGDVFLVSYSPTGNEQWAKSIGGSGFEECTAICYTPNVGLYLTGSFISSTFNFDAFSINNQGTATRDVFLAGCSFNDGSCFKLQGIGGPLDEIAYGMVSGNNEVFLTGNFESTSIDFDNQTLTNAGGEDIFLCASSYIGNYFYWAQSMGGPGDDVAYSLDFFALSSNIVVAGSFSSSNLPFNTNYNLVNQGLDDLFLAKTGTVITNVIDYSVDKPTLQVFPNPAQNELNIFMNGQSQGMATLILRAVSGAIVLHKKIQLGNQPPGRISLNIENLSPGFYTLTLQNSEGQFQTKIVKE